MKKYMSMNILNQDGTAQVYEYEGEISTINPSVFLVPLKEPPSEEFIAIAGVPRMEAISLGLSLDRLSDTPELAREAAHKFMKSLESKDPESIAYINKAINAPSKVQSGGFYAGI